MIAKGVLIIGGDGLVGHALGDHYARLGIPVSSTSRRSLGSGEYLDLAHPNLNKLKFELKRYSHAIIAGGNTNLVQCELDPVGTSLCNVKGTLELARQLYLEGIKPIAFSSDYVFDGKKDVPYTEKDVLKPLNEYGKQKAELESHLPSLCPNFYLIIRLAKVYSLDAQKKCWIAKMATTIKEGKSVLAAYDQIFCPIFLEDVVQAVYLLWFRDAMGVCNLGGPQVLNRYQVAQKVGEHFSASPALVRPISLQDLGEPFMRPKMTALSSLKFESLTQMKTRSLEDLMCAWVPHSITPDNFVQA